MIAALAQGKEERAGRGVCLGRRGAVRMPSRSRSRGGQAMSEPVTLEIFTDYV
jgi:hypothetical protein